MRSLATAMPLLPAVMLAFAFGAVAEEQVEEQVEETKWLDMSNRFMDMTRAPMSMLESNSPFFQKRDLYFFGRLELDAAHYSSGVLADDSGAYARRFRAGLIGHLSKSDNWNYKLEFDLMDSENRVSDAYINWTPSDWGTIRIGNQKVAQTLSGSTSTLTVPFLERPLPALAFALQRRLGVGFDLHRPDWGAQATLFSRDLNEHYGSKGYAGRAYYRFNADDGGVIHLGASALTLDGDDRAEFRARPESHGTNTRLVDTGVFEDVDAASAYGLEGAVVRDGVTVRGEYYSATWRRPDRPDPNFDGWYLEGAWLLGGNQQSYDRGKFFRPDITNKRGAWELTFRYSTVDLNSKEVEGGTEDNVTAGVNWYSPLHWRVLLNVIKVDADGPFGKQNPWIAQTRVQYFF